MKISRILPLVVGSAAGIMLSSASPTKAAPITFSLNPTALNGTGLTATGTATFDDSLLIPNQAIFTPGSTIGLDGFSFNVSNGDSFNLSQITSWVLATDASANITDLNFFGGTATSGATINGISPFTLQYIGTQTEVFSLAPTAAAVPFDIPGGATIPTVGSLFALAVMRKAKKSLAAKKQLLKLE